MTISVDTIIADVEKCIDEIGIDEIGIDEIRNNESEWLSDKDNKEMNSIITSKIEDALRFVYMNADSSLLDLTWKGDSELTKLPTHSTSDKTSYYECLLADDVLRLCYVKATGWQFHLTEPILYTDKEYATLKNPITTGYPDNPKMALVFKKNNNENAKVLELYGVEGENPTVSIAYMAEPKETNSSYDIPSKVYRAAVYYVAGLTLLTYKDSHADSLFNQALIMIGAK